MDDLDLVAAAVKKWQVTSNMVMWSLTMATPSNFKPVRVKVREHRERLRAQGLRPIQIWAPDVRSPVFRDEAHRQSRAVAASDRAREDQAFIDAISDSEWDDE